MLLQPNTLFSHIKHSIEKVVRRSFFKREIDTIIGNNRVEFLFEGLRKGERSHSARSHQAANHNAVDRLGWISKGHIQDDHALTIFAEDVPDSFAPLAMRHKPGLKRGRGNIELPEVEHTMLSWLETGHQRHPGWRRHGGNS